MSHPADKLRAIMTFDELIPYLQEELDWPLEEYGFDDLTFEYSPTGLGLSEEQAAKVKTIHQGHRSLPAHCRRPARDDAHHGGDR